MQPGLKCTIRKAILGRGRLGCRHTRVALASLTGRGVVAHEQVALGAVDGALRRAAAQGLRTRPHHLREVAGALAEPCAAQSEEKESQRSVNTVRLVTISVSIAGHSPPKLSMQELTAWLARSQRVCLCETAKGSRNNVG